MPHVDDGILHAHLDGALDALSEAGELPDGMSAADVLAHLRSCPDCSSRLRIERDLRERAGLLLADAVPAQLELPPFPAVQAATPARRRRAWIPMSWAASMLMALGAGWWGSEVWRATTANESFAVDQAARQSPMSAEDAGVPASSGGDIQSQSSGLDASDPFAGTPSSPAATGSTQPRLPSEPVAENALPATTNAPGPPAANASTAPATNASNPPAADVSNALVAGPPPPASRDLSAPAKQTTPNVARPPRSGVQAAVPSVAQVAPQREPVPNLDSQQVAVSSEAPIIRSEMATSLLRSATDSRASSGHLNLIAQAADSAAFDRLLQDIEDVRFGDADNTVLTGRALTVIGDASVPVIETAAVDDQLVVRVRQTLGSGEVVEVVSWQPSVTIENIDLSAAAASSPAERTQLMPDARMRGAPLAQREADTALSTLSDGRRQLIVRTAAGQWVALRADLSATEIRMLMTRMLSSSRQ